VLRITWLEADRGRGSAFLIAVSEAFSAGACTTFLKTKGLQPSLFLAHEMETLKFGVRMGGDCGGEWYEEQKACGYEAAHDAIVEAWVDLGIVMHKKC
jgi:hypothetical protein